MPTEREAEHPSSLKTHYVKSNFFRTVHVDGAFGGFTPSGQIYFSVYSERAPLPDVTVQSVEHGQIGKEIIDQRKSSDGIVRELETGMIMSIPVAKSLMQWLQERIKVAEEMQTSSISHPVEANK